MNHVERCMWNEICIRMRQFSFKETHTSERQKRLLDLDLVVLLTEKDYVQKIADCTPHT